MDRLFLKRWSARLADDDFARAVAGAYLQFGNAEPALRAMTADLTAPRTPRQSPQKPIRIVWKLYPDSSDTLPPAEDAVALWQDVVQKFRPTKPGHPQNALHGINRPQLLLSMTGSSLAELLAFAKILTVIDDIDGISINPTPPMPKRSQWRLPFAISTLADDALADAL